MAKLVTYSNEYIEKIFQYWYTGGCPPVSELMRRLNDDPSMKDEHGRIPSISAIDAWFEDYNFRARKDLIDARVATQIDDDMVALKVNMLREQAAQFRAIRQKAAKFLLETDFDTSSAAVNAFIRASQEERVALGLSKAVQKIAAMDDDDLLKNVRELAAKVSNEVLDAEEVEDEDAEGQ